MSDRIEQLEKKIAEAKQKVAANLVPGGDPGQHMPSIFNTILGSKVSGFLTNVPASTTEARRRQAQRELETAEKQLEREKKKSRSGSGDSTPAEEAEERRENQIRENEVAEKEDEALDLLKSIKKNTDRLDPTIVAIGGVGGARGGGGGAAAGADAAGGGIDWLDLGLLGGMLLPGPLKLLAKTRVGQFATGFFSSARVAKTGGQIGFAGLMAQQAAATKNVKAAGTATKLSRAARVLSMGRFFGGLVSFGISEAVWQMGSAMIDEANREIAASEALLNVGLPQKDAEGVSRSTNVGVQTDFMGRPIPGTGIVLSTPESRRTDETGTESFARDRLKENEHLIMEQIELADKALEESRDEDAMNHFETIQTFLNERGEIARAMTPKDWREAVDIIRFDSEPIYDKSRHILRTSEHRINSFWSPMDWTVWKRTYDLFEQFNPKRAARMINLGAAKEGHESNRIIGDTAIDKALRTMGFAGTRRTPEGGTEVRSSPQREAGKRRKQHNLGQPTPEPISMLPAQRMLNGMMNIERNAAGTFENTLFASSSPNVMLSNVNAPTISQQNTTNYVADGYNDASFMDRERAMLFNEANYNIRGYLAT